MSAGAAMVGPDEAAATRRQEALMDRLGGARDDLYAELLAAHDGLDSAQSAALNARLVLILMNQVGEPAAIRAAIAAARVAGAAAVGEREASPPR